MDTTQYHDEELRQLFARLQEENPSEGFTAQVMTQVFFEKQRAANLKRMRLIAWAVSIPCSVALLVFVVYFTHNYWEIYLWNFFEPLLTSMNSIFSSITELFTGNGNRIFLPGLVFLTLLLADLFLRHYAERKTNLSNPNSVF